MSGVDMDTLHALIRGQAPLRGIKPAASSTVAEPRPAPTIASIMEALRDLPEPEPGVAIGTLYDAKVYVAFDRDEIILVRPADQFGDATVQRFPIGHPTLDGTKLQGAARHVRQALAHPSSETP